MSEMQWHVTEYNRQTNVVSGLPQKTTLENLENMVQRLREFAEEPASPKESRHKIHWLNGSTEESA